MARKKNNPRPAALNTTPQPPVATELPPSLADVPKGYAELLEGLKALKGRDGTPEAEAIRRAIAAYLEHRGVKIKADRKRVSALKRR